ncbi:hypothetical protein Daesc_009634 [Daldinia eschscholtzii]|uniref:Uncharacterized protein n=1 Tax=Daldinia eschscholtzii TaxID=292717 RepID=A0AAX6MBI8_9PEZI
MAKIEVPQAQGLYDPVHLKKLEKLQNLNISYDTRLPQIVVIGGQSAGKSSVLESLSGFPFPRDPICGTRYITEVIYRKHDKDTVVASIEPDRNSTSERTTRLRAFQVNLSPTTRDGMTIPDIFQSASAAMGVCLEVDEARSSISLYSKDVLQVEVTGPKEEYLKIIDCPGTPSEPVQESKIEKHIEASHTIILAVVPCAADVEDDPDFLRLGEADPDGRRSIVVLTKPDLAMESAPGREAVDPVEIIRKVIGPNYLVVRNRGENEATSDLAQRNYVEHAFFNEDPWNQVHNQLYQPLFGARSLRLRVQEFLEERTEQYFIELGKELKARLKHKQKGLELLGETRVNTDRRRIYLSRVAIRFSDIFNRALGPQCAGQLSFSVDFQLCLAAQVQEMSKAFASILFSRGHSSNFEGEEAYCEDEWMSPPYESRGDLFGLHFSIPEDHEYPEIQVLLSEAFYCSRPRASGIMGDIRQIYSDCCGGALGVFNNTILPPLFRNQTRKWVKLTLAHVSNVILVIHDFVYSALRTSCPDRQVLQALWEFHKQGFLDCYRRAIKHAELLLHVECEGDMVVTSNPEFERLLAEYRMERRREAAKPSRDASRYGIGNQEETHRVVPSDFTEEVCNDTHDALKAYYEIARARLVDNIHQQVVTHFLLRGEQSVLQVFTPERVLSMTSEELRSIAEEHPDNARSREELQQEIDNLEKALDVIRA